MSKTNIILNNTQIQQKTLRIAYQIYENNSKEEAIVLAGIANNGYLFAERLAKELKRISPLKVLLCKVTLDKKNVLSAVETSLNSDVYSGKSLVLVDDVLNSGATLIYAIKHFLEVPLKRFKTAVLVNRNHKKYPVKADFKGISLSTSIQEQVVLEITAKKATAYLM